VRIYRKHQLNVGQNRMKPFHLEGGRKDSELQSVGNPTRMANCLAWDRVLQRVKPHKFCSFE